MWDSFRKNSVIQNDLTPLDFGLCNDTSNNPDHDFL